MLPPLFAFGITNLPMLGWLAAAAAPILIHLWSRRKYREIPWAAMEYLLAAAKRQTRRLQFEQWLLLAIRTLLVVLLVLAVAEPYAEQAGLALAAGGHAHRVLVLDGSYSMAYRPTDKTRFERAKELARQIVDESPPGDAFTLVLMSSPPRVVVASPARERGEIAGEIDSLRLPQTTADLPATIRAIRQVVDGARRENPRLVRHEVYFLTDLQRVTWAPKLSEAAAAEFLRQTEELAQTAVLFLIDLGQPTAENLAVTSLRTADPLMTVGRSVQIETELKNFGRQALRRQPVELLVDRQRVEQKDVDIGPDGTASVGFSYRFDVPGDHAIEVRAPGDALDVDNHRFLAAPVRQATRVLCIDGRPSGRPFHGAADYLAIALAPNDGDGGRFRHDAAPSSKTDGENVLRPHALIQADVTTENAVMDRNLAGYDCVFLCNVAQFTASEARVLDAYLQSGGNLVFFLGDQVLAQQYNRELGVTQAIIGENGHPKRSEGSDNTSAETPRSAKDDKRPPGKTGQGRAGGPHILPARLGPLVDRPQFRLDPRDYRHPIVQPFRGRGETSLLTTPVFKHYQLAVPENSPTETVLALADGDPLVVETPVHRGRVVLVATSAEPAWVALPLWPSFVPLVQEIVAWCARGQLQQRNLLVGDPLDGSITTQSGISVVRIGPPPGREQTFAVNVDTVESDLAQIDPEQLQYEVWPGVPFVHQTSWQDLGATGPGSPIRSGSRLHLALLYAVLSLLFVETFLGWRLGHY